MSSPIESENPQDGDDEVLEVPSDVFQELVDIAREEAPSASFSRPRLREPHAWEWRSWSLLNRLRR